jgi:oxygen-independent coproporphyrinogen-3 oxidase
VGDKVPTTGAPMNGENSGTIAQYVEVLCQEILHTPSEKVPLTSVFFGGGTPSLLSVAQVGQILTKLDQRFGIASEAEVSLEVDPGTFDHAQILGYRQVGVNRLSLGVQAFQPQLLAACGRSHSVDDIYQAVDWISEAGFTNWSLDLISGLPHQTLADWQTSLESAIALAPTHLSCYDLAVEPGTAFDRQFQPGASPLPDDDTTANLYRLAQRLLTTAGYDHYEISNYSKPGYACRHNCVYWQNRAFYGFGMGATSYVNGYRYARPRKTQAYYEWVKQAIAIGSPFPSLVSSDTPICRYDWLLDTLMVGLRLREGIALRSLIPYLNADEIQRLQSCLEPYIHQGWVSLSNICSENSPLERSGYLRLTDPEGFLFSNVVLTALFQAFEPV